VFSPQSLIPHPLHPFQQFQAFVGMNSTWDVLPAFTEASIASRSLRVLVNSRTLTPESSLAISSLDQTAAALEVSPRDGLLKGEWRPAVVFKPISGQVERVHKLS